MIYTSYYKVHNKWKDIPKIKVNLVCKKYRDLSKFTSFQREIPNMPHLIIPFQTESNFKFQFIHFLEKKVILKPRTIYILSKTKNYMQLHHKHVT